MDTIFSKIIRKEIPAKIVFEDDLCLAFRDIAPQAPTHILIIPKKPILRLAEATSEHEHLLGHLLLVAGEVARKENVDDTGFRLVINNGPDAGEAVPHFAYPFIGRQGHGLAARLVNG